MVLNLDFLIGICLGVLVCHLLRIFYNWITPPEERDDALRIVFFWGWVTAIGFFLAGFLLGRSF